MARPTTAASTAAADLPAPLPGAVGDEAAPAGDEAAPAGDQAAPVLVVADNGDPSTDQRGAERFRLLLRVAKLRTTTGEFLCVLRDISDLGLKVRIFHDIPRDALCELELGGGEIFQVQRVWQHGGHAGFKFADTPVEADRLIDEAGPFPKRHIRLRFKRPVPVMLMTDGLAMPADLCDISQHGAALSFERRLAIGQQVRIDTPHLPELTARVRWRRGRLHGIVFQEGFRLDALAEVAARMQLDHSGGGAAAASLDPPQPA